MRLGLGLGLDAAIRVGFNPASISGLQWRFRADSITGISDGGAVATWTDISGNGRDATQSTGSKKPTLVFNQINGKKIVRFDGVDDALTMGLVITASSTTFVVTKATPASSAAYAPFIITPSFRLCVKLGAGSNWGTYVGSDLTAGEALSASTPALVEMSSSASGVVLYRDGVQKATSGSSSVGNVTLQSIGDETGSSRFASADIAEILTYNSVLSSADRSKVEKYLGGEYGISV